MSGTGLAVDPIYKPKLQPHLFRGIECGVEQNWGMLESGIEIRLLHGWVGGALPTCMAPWEPQVSMKSKASPQLSVYSGSSGNSCLERDRMMSDNGAQGAISGALFP